MKEWPKIFKATEHEDDNIRSLDINKIQSNPYQPRTLFDPEKIKELAQSIKTYGLLQPVIVRDMNTCFQLIAGERRLLACRELGWETIPAIIKDINDSGMGAVALIENLQRENLHFLEEASGFLRLIEEFGLTQEVLAQRLGKSQSTIANKLRILRLSPDIRELIYAGNLTERHARALLKLPLEEDHEKILKQVIENNYNVKQTENIVENYLQYLKDKERPKNMNKKKVVIRDLRIFINTIRQSIKVIKKAGLNPLVTEKDCGNHFEITIRLPKDMESTHEY
ncbi:nucleoid occlusion protein [Candidatus Contubernalis alkaliaceticus]|uniref:nucleoid occlusion protein n=1 Tax=Candidatus Contubernalis alkaliaceticus TaxID=338645 RepID=UPI001F4C1FF7|nr:nucleoid occlusion protein [Candidatus Contubernalis alkalaceticus]UNC93726.1 nucleoid occlusion protein [Candidatus Contubernalis alkalaceticus]